MIHFLACGENIVRCALGLCGAVDKRKTVIIEH